MSKGIAGWKRAAEYVTNQEYLQQSLPFIHGTWYFVDPGKSKDGHGKTIKNATNDIETAYDKCGNNGDGICLLTSGTSTSDCTSYLSASIAWSKNNITLFGAAAPTMYAGRARISHSAEDIEDLIVVSGYNNRFYNIHMYNGGTTGTGALKVTGDRNYFQTVHAIGGGGVTSASVADMDLSLAGDENTFVGCAFGSDTFDKEDLAGFSMEFASGGLCARNHFFGCEFNQYRAAGTTAGAISIGNVASIARMNVFDGCLFAVFDDGTPAVDEEVAVIIGAKPDAGYIVLKDCMRVGFSDWSLTTQNTSVFTNSVVAHEAGGAGVIANPS